MKLKALMVWVGMPLLLLLLVMERKIVRYFPPYQAGVHDLVVEAQTNRSNVDGPHVGNCPVFPRDNVWNMPIDKLPIDKRSAAYIESIGGDKKVKADTGSDLRYGMPYTLIPPGTKHVKVTIGYRDDSDLGNYPVPPDAPIEGGAASAPDSDRHVIFIDPARCILYEFFAAKKISDTEWDVGSGIKMDLMSNAIRSADKGSADAAGMPIFPGLLKYDEVASGEINHALRFTVTHTQSAYIWPARHKASHDTNPNTPPMGMRMRLRRDFDISSYSKANQTIMKALKKYGMFLTDNGAPIYISGVPDKRWDDYDLKKLGGMTGADFEVVDESDWQMLPDSGKVDPLMARPQ